jgi:hypothetical protein
MVVHRTMVIYGYRSAGKNRLRTQTRDRSLTGNRYSALLPGLTV